ncbi:hypothetical protein C2845_PM17G14920 [Panicum miliaceum]|uniref:Uncharacterized protein n=1 Tax=Panicum miliaceum TaxID=4540 RepID=A0A3L6Q467_PANMI|nr:hypothetical protein C2845_PM17G14920 [Panicum miliaceum]
MVSLLIKLENPIHDLVGHRNGGEHGEHCARRRDGDGSSERNAARPTVPSSDHQGMLSSLTGGCTGLPADDLAVPRAWHAPPPPPLGGQGMGARVTDRRKPDPNPPDGEDAIQEFFVFGTGSKYHDNQWDSTIDKIVKKCGGSPLAVLAIANLIASKPREEWHDVFNSISSELGGVSEADSIRRLLLRSYYHLPSHLRACFLYVSVFPEDYEFRRDKLVWRWIAEGFIQEKQGCSLFEIGQTYFEELLNRNMIQEVEKNVSDGMVQYCRAHDLMLDIACSLASDENFVTKLVDEQEQQTSSERKIRRLSLQNSRLLERRTCTMQMPHVRSVAAFGTGINLMPPLTSFRVLRVLDLEGCDLRGSSYDLEHLGELLHLRYLGLRGTNVAQLPKDIGNLRFLQILDLKGTTIRVLPSAVALLRKLLCLYTEHETRMPEGLENLTSLEELSKISVSEYPGFLKELTSLVELRVLDILLPQQGVSESSQKDFMGSLCNLRKIQDLRVSGCSDLDFMREGWEPTPSVRRFIAADSCWFSVLPTWASNAKNLSELHLGVMELWREDLQSLGRLRQLRFLRLAVERMGERLAVDADAFPSLTQLRLRGETCLVFHRGAMPKLAILEFVLDVDKANGDIDWGLGNLPSLKKVTVNHRCANDASAVSAEEALYHATSAHPNRRTLEITMKQNVLHNEERTELPRADLTPSACMQLHTPHDSAAEDGTGGLPQTGVANGGQHVSTVAKGRAVPVTRQQAARDELRVGEEQRLMSGRTGTSGQQAGRRTGMMHETNNKLDLVRASPDLQPRID